MADVTLSDVNRGIRGRFKTFRGTYTHSTGADQTIQTGLTRVNSWRVMNTTEADNDATGAVSGGAITITAATITDTSVVVVTAEGW